MTSATTIQWPTAGGNLASLKMRETRIGIINMFRSIGAPTTPVDAAAVERMIAIDHQIHNALSHDLVALLNEATSARSDDSLAMLRDVALLHSVAGKALVDLLDRSAEWSSANEELRLQIANLATYHYSDAAKWGFFRHEPVKSALWTQLHRLYAIAESGGYAASPCYLFADEDATFASITSRYLQILLLELLNTTNLPAVQTEIADAWLADWAPRYALDVQYEVQHHRLFVDIDMPVGLQIFTDTGTTEGYRFLRMHDTQYQLAALRELLRAGKLSGGARVEQYAIEHHLALEETFSKLNAAMFDAKSSAIEPRQPVADQFARVVSGFAEIVAALNGAPADVMDMSIPPSLALAPITGKQPAIEPGGAGTHRSESDWQLTDISRKGIGLRIEGTALGGAATGLEPGELMLARVGTDQGTDWLLLNIARKKTTVETVRVGAEILSREPIALQATRIGAALPEGSMSAIFDPTVSESRTETTFPSSLWALYLPGEADDARADSIVFASAEIGAGNMVEVSSPAGKFVLRLSRVVRKGRSWIAYRFDVLEQRQ